MADLGVILLLGLATWAVALVLAAMLVVPMVLMIERCYRRRTARTRKERV